MHNKQRITAPLGPKNIIKIISTDKLAVLLFTRQTTHTTQLQAASGQPHGSSRLTPSQRKAPEIKVKLMTYARTHSRSTLTYTKIKLHGLKTTGR